MTASHSTSIETHAANYSALHPARCFARFAALVAALASLLAVVESEIVVAQETKVAEEARPTGLPGNVEWTFNLDAGVGTFGFNNSLYVTAPSKADSSGDLSDDWIESYVKAGLTGGLPLKNGMFFGKASALGERTFSAPPSLVGDDASSFQVEDAYLGWRSGSEEGADGFELMGGRAPYKIGRGFLLWDGAGDGGSRGGFWSGPRKAWNTAGIGRLRTKRNSLEAFYLDRDELPESDTGTKVWGANYELKLGQTEEGAGTTIGLSYLETSANTIILRDGMSVYDARLYSQPFPGALSGLFLEAEYAQEDNADVLKSTGWTAGAGFSFNSIPWSPQLSYRYAYFQGDDPSTSKSEAFDPLFPGFYDWGTWWQGEIAGEYFLSNSNLISHQVRLHLRPTESLTTGLIGYAFYLDRPETFAAGVTSDEVAVELDGYLDWKINSNFTTSLVLAYAEPKKAIEQGYGRTENMSYGMLYVSYAY